MFVLNHPGTGKEYFKEDSPEQVDRYVTRCLIDIHFDKYTFLSLQTPMGA